MADPKNKKKETKVVVDPALVAMEEVNKLFGDSNLVFELGKAKGMDIQRTPCGILSIDAPFGGGTPDGRIIEIFGKESSGKTTTALHILEGYQRRQPNKRAAFIDFEHAFDPTYAANLGVDIDRLIFSQPTYAEQGLGAIDTLIKSGGYSVVVVDSVAAMTPKKELEGDMGDASIGVQARLMSQAMRKLTGTANKTKTTIIFLNQMREKIGVMFGNPWVTAGGNALKFYSSIRVEIFKGTQVKDADTDVVGFRGKMKVVKNKTYPPFRESEFDIEFGYGISREGSLLDYGVEFGLIKQSGSWFSMDDTKIGQGRTKVKKVLRDNPDLCDEMEKRIRKELEFEEL
jgi:recombination protein RecA